MSSPILSLHLDMKILDCFKAFTRHRIIGRCLESPYIYRCTFRCIHTTAQCFAVPLPHLAAPGPPPSPPEQGLTSFDNSLSHRKRRIEQLNKRNAVKNSQETKSGTLRKRFWKDVHVRKYEGIRKTLLR